AGGAGVFQFAERVGGIEVFRARASVVVDGQNRLVSIANSLAPSEGLAKATSFVIAGEGAIAAAYQAQSGVPLAASAVHAGALRSEDIRSYAVSAPLGSLRVLEATAKRV